MKFVPKGSITNNPALFQIMAYLKQRWLVHWHIYASLCLNKLKCEFLYWSHSKFILNKAPVFLEPSICCRWSSKSYDWLADGFIVHSICMPYHVEWLHSIFNIHLYAVHNWDIDAKTIQILHSNVSQWDGISRLFYYISLHNAHVLHVEYECCLYYIRCVFQDWIKFGCSDGPTKP